MKVVTRQRRSGNKDEDNEIGKPRDSNEKEIVELDQIKTASSRTGQELEEKVKIFQREKNREKKEKREDEKGLQAHYAVVLKEAMEARCTTKTCKACCPAKKWQDGFARQTKWKA